MGLARFPPLSVLRILFFSFAARSWPLLALPRMALTPPFFCSLAILRSYLSLRTLFFFLSARRCNRSGSIALMALRSVGSSLASASASLAWWSAALVLGRLAEAEAEEEPCFLSEGSRGAASLAGAAFFFSLLAAAALARAAATPVLQRSRRTLRLETLRYLPAGRARSSSTQASS